MDKIICLGKNYADHSKEMKEGHPDKPLLFMKPPSCLISPKNQGAVELPWDRGDIHFEGEIVFKLYKKNIIGLALGLDLTFRNLQKELKQKGHPWEIAKSFKNSAIISPIKGLKDFPQDWENLSFEIKINQELRQKSKLQEAHFKANQIIHHIDQYLPLCDGDLIFSGTPKGVGPLKKNDDIELSFGPIHHHFSVI